MQQFFFAFLWGFLGFLLYRITAYYTYDEDMNTDITTNLIYAAIVGVVVAALDVFLLGAK